MRSALTLAALAVAALAPSTVADARPSFPITLAVDYCIGDGCYDMEITIEEDGTFIDSDRDGGIWFYRPSEQTILFRYDGDAEGIEFFGTRDGRCFEGTVFIDEEEDNVWEACAI